MSELIERCSLAFYFRIFPFRRFKYLLLVVAALSVAYGISVDVTIFLQWYKLGTLHGETRSNTGIRSRPMHYQWDLVYSTAKGSCVNFHAFFVGKGIANVCLNVLIFILVSSSRATRYNARCVLSTVE